MTTGPRAVRFRWRGLLLCFCVLSLCLPYSARANPLIVGVSDGNYDALRIENGRFVGVLAKIYQCVFERLDIEHEFRMFPQVRVLHLLERGEIDLGLPLIRVRDRDAYARFTHAMVEAPFHLYSRHDIGPQDDLSQFRFVIRRTGASHELLTRRNAFYDEVADWRQALRLVRIGRFDGTVIPEQIAQGFPLEDFGDLQRSLFGTMPLAIYVSRKADRADALVDRLNRLIDGCRIH